MDSFCKDHVIILINVRDKQVIPEYCKDATISFKIQPDCIKFINF